MKLTHLIALSAALALTSALNSANAQTSKASQVPDYSKTCRPAPKDRLFVSMAVDQTIVKVKSQLKNPKLAWMFENCYPNTLDTTVHFGKDEDGDYDTFVYTGDIHAMASASATSYPPSATSFASNSLEYSLTVISSINKTHLLLDSAQK